MKRYSYYWPLAAVQISTIVFLSQSFVEAAGARKPGFEWVWPVCGIVMAAAYIYAAVITILNARMK